MSAAEDKDSLDSLSLEVIELSSALIESKCKLEDLLKGAYNNLAESRYVMGSKSVSQLQLPSGDKVVPAIVKVERETIPAGRGNDRDHNKQLYHLISSSDIALELQSSVSNRHRNDLSAQTFTKSNQSNDPLRWFGILTPPSLKAAQKKFKNILEHIVDIANLQCELDLKISLYNELKKAKFNSSN